MSTFKNLIPILPHPQGKLIPLVPGSSPSVRQRVGQDDVMRQLPSGLMGRFSAFVRECWRRMRIMAAATEQAESGDGAQSRERSKELLRYEQAWSDNSSSVSQTELSKKG